MRGSGVVQKGLAIAVPLADRDEGRVSVRKPAGFSLIAVLPAVTGARIRGFITFDRLATILSPSREDSSRVWGLRMR